MRIVIVAWVSEGAGARFETNVPLQFVGQRNRDCGYSNEIDLVFLEGLDRLDPAYVESLRDCGFMLRDAAVSFRQHADRFTALDRFNAYEKRCFLRWPVLTELYGSEPLLHFDGDVVFNQNPAVLMQHFLGRSMILQGCPAVTAISDPVWYHAYITELGRYANDIEGYAADAREERSRWENTSDAAWAGTWDRRLLCSDQDFLSHLIRSGRILQSDPAPFVASGVDHVYFENPLLIGDLVPEWPLTYRRLDGIDYLNRRRVALWHMQTDWCRYLARHCLRESLGSIGGKTRIPFREKDWSWHAASVLRVLTGNRVFDRSALYRRFFTSGNFDGIFNDHRWWQSGVFAEPSMAR